VSDGIDTARDIERASISDYLPLPEAHDQYPIEYMENFSVIKLREEEDRVVVGLCNPGDHVVREYLRAFHRKQVVFREIDHSELALYLGRKMSVTEGTDEPVGDGDKLLLDKLANDAPVINLVNSIFIEGIRTGASDIHIESFRAEATVRYRVDGMLKRATAFDRKMFPAVASRIKIMSNLNIMERRLPQDGRLTVHLGQDVLDMRVSIMPIADGESIVLRLFTKENAPLSLEELGFAPAQLSVLNKLSRLPHGLVLATGPTGSGKTTTLNGMLRQIDAETRKIITIEDPIEYLLNGIDQIQTNERIGLTFESILRRVLRQDPDVIMVGEIRDMETAELAVRAALTGHLVFSTLHTNDSVSAVTRLRNMGVPAYLIAAVTRAVIAQRLVRRLCVECRKSVRPGAAEKKLFDQTGVEVRQLYVPQGCDACRGTGYSGRIALVEMFAADDRVAQMIVEDTPTTAITKYLVEGGMALLLADGLAKAARGVTALEEVERTVLLS